MTVALVALLLGGVLLYAGLQGKSVTRLLLGDSQVPQPNRPLNQAGG